MRYRLIAIAAATLLSGSLCLGSETSSREGARLTCDLLRVQLVKDYGSRTLSDDLFYAPMKGSPQDFPNPETSFHALKRRVARLQGEQFTAEARRIVERINSNAPEKIDDLLGEDYRKTFVAPPQDVIMANIERQLGKRYDPNANNPFTRARRRVCAEQMQALTFDLYPTETQLETESKEAITRLLSTQFRNRPAGRNLFAENIPLLSTNIIVPIIDDAVAQYNLQLQTVNASDGGRSQIPSGKQAYMVAQLEELRKGFARDRKGRRIANKVYGIFPTVWKAAQTRAEGLVLDAFASALHRMEGDFTISPDDITAFIRENLKPHINTKASLGECIRKFAPTIRERAIEKYVSQAPRGERTELSEFLPKALKARTGTHTTALERLINSALNDSFTASRNALIDEQMKEYYPSLADKSWRPSDKVVETYCNRTWISFNNVDVSTVKGTPPIKSWKRAILLDGTTARARRTVEKLVKEAVSASRKQGVCISRVDKELQSELKKMETLPRERELIQDFRNRVAKLWKAEELSAKYEKIFPHEDERLVKYAKALLPREKERRKAEETRKRNEERQAARSRRAPQPGPDSGSLQPDGGKTPDPGKGTEQGSSGGGDDSSSGRGGTGKGGGSGQGEGASDEIRPDFLIDVSMAYHVTLITKEGGVTELNLSPTRFANTRQRDRILEEVSIWLAQQIYAASKRNQKQVTTFFMLRVFDDRTPYWVVRDIREEVIKAVALTRSVLENRKLKIKVKVLWYDDLFEPEDIKKRTVPPKYRDRGMPLTA